MKADQFGKYLLKLDQTASRNEMTVILADLIRMAGEEEIEKIIYLILGRLSPAYDPIELRIAEKTMVKIIAQTFGKPPMEILKKFKKSGDLGDIIYQLSTVKPQKALTVNEIHQRLLTIAKQEGLGSTERKMNLFGKLIKDLDPLSGKYIVRIPLGKLRLGFSDLTILDALSWSKTGDKSLREKIESAYNVTADIGLVVGTFKKYGAGGLVKMKPISGVPIKPALASRLKTPDEIIKKLTDFALEPKYDGFRLQLHLDRNKGLNDKEKISLFENRQSSIKMFSRQMENITSMFPDLIEDVENIKAKSVVIDGEVVGINKKTGRFLPFQETAQRKRKYNISETAKKVPIKYFAFDILELDGRSMIKKSFTERRKILAKIIGSDLKNIKLTPQKRVKNRQQLEKYFNEYIDKGLEGIICKKLASPYRPGGRDFTWVKYKKAMASKLIDTIDCLVLGYYRGRGKRSNFGIGAFLTAVFDPSEKTFLTIAKIGTGLTDQQWQEMRKKIDRAKASLPPKEYRVPKGLIPDVWAEPEIVVEIAADEITKSPIHSSNYALRFPRMKKFRAKTPEDITGLKEVKKIYRMQ